MKEISSTIHLYSLEWICMCFTLSLYFTSIHLGKESLQKLKNIPK